jgi:hypothetical protein
MKSNHSVPDLPPKLAAARRRMPRHWRGPEGRARKTQNNYIAENLASIGHNSGNRNGAGSRSGNENAAKAPRDFRLMVAYSFWIRRRVRALIAVRKALLAAREHAL